MKVEIDWTEEVTYKSTIEVDTAVVLAWLNEGEDGGDMFLTEADVSDEDVRTYFTECDDFEWFEECDTTADFVSVDERDLLAVRLIRKEVPSDAPV